MQSKNNSESAWAIRGIPEDIRRAVAERAKAEGRTVGAWVTAALKRALEEDALTDQIAELRRRIEILETIKGSAN